MWMWSGWHGKVGELIRALGHKHWSISIVMCPVLQAELPPKHLNPSAAFIRGLLSLLINRLIGPKAFYFSLLVWLQHFIEFMSRFTSTTMSDIHAGRKITRQHFNQQPFLCHWRDCYQYATLIGIFKLQTKINWIRLWCCRFAFWAC